MNFKKTISAGLALLLLAGCGSSNNGGSAAKPESSGSEAAPVAGEGSRLVVAINADLNTMDHHIATDGGSFVMQSMCIGGLAELDADAQPVPDLAESWDIEDEGTKYTFHIRPEANWSNGTPVTAQDFVYGWRRLVDPELQSEYAFIMETIKVKNAGPIANGEMPIEELGVEAVDDKTFVVTLDQPCGFLMGLMAFPSFFPLNQEFFEAQGDQYSLSVDNLIYCGPYTMTGWEAGSEYTFTKNPNYWNAAAQADTVDEVVFKFVPETQSAALSYQQGEIDVVTLSGELVDQYSSDPGFTNRLQGYAWRLNLNQSTEHIATNTKFQNFNLRKALSLAIDRDQIAKNVLKDGSVAAEGFIPKDFAFGPDGKDYRETVGNLLSFDPAAAAEAYNAAKSELGGDVTVELLYEDSEASKQVAENIQFMWQTNLPGITVNLLSKTKKERLDLMNGLNYEIGLTRWGPDYADPQTYLDLFKSNSAGYNNYYFNEAYDAALDDAETGIHAADPEARWQDLITAEKIIVEDFGIIPVYQNGSAVLMNPNVKGIEYHNAGVDSYRHVTKTE